MLSEKDVQAWLSTFDKEVKEALFEVSKLEPWILDSDPEVMECCNRISDALKTTSIDPVTGEKIQQYNYSLITDVSLSQLSVIQGQLSFVRGIKLFGDLCFIDRNFGLEMLSLRSDESSPQEVKVSSSLLFRRIQLLIALQLIDRVFSSDRLSLMKDILVTQFDESSDGMD